MFLPFLANFALPIAREASQLETLVTKRIWYMHFERVADLMVFILCFRPSQEAS